MYEGEVKDKWAIQDARKILADTVKAMPQMMHDHKHEPDFLVGYLAATVETSLNRLTVFADANPEFAKWR